MSNQYITQAGITITEKSNGDLAAVTGGFTAYIDETLWVALQEYFQHRWDKKCKRWRDPENSNWVVYRDKYNAELLTVIDEETGEVDYVNQRNLAQPPHPAEDSWVWVAWRFVQAHSEPNPWQNAQLGEVWELTFEGRAPFAALVEKGTMSDDLLFMWKGNGCFIDDETIVAGRRIWPQLEGEEK